MSLGRRSYQFLPWSLPRVAPMLTLILMISSPSAPRVLAGQRSSHGERLTVPLDPPVG